LGHIYGPENLGGSGWVGGLEARWAEMEAQRRAVSNPGATCRSRGAGATRVPLASCCIGIRLLIDQQLTEDVNVNLGAYFFLIEEPPISS